MERLAVSGDMTSVNHVSIESIFSSDLPETGITKGTPWLEWQSEAMLDEEDRGTRGFTFVIRGYRILEGPRSRPLTVGGESCLLPRGYFASQLSRPVLIGLTPAEREYESPGLRVVLDEVVVSRKDIGLIPMPGKVSASKSSIYRVVLLPKGVIRACEIGIRNVLS